MHNGKGFTLIELLFSIAILVVISSLVIPGFENLRVFSQSVAATQQLMATLNFSRQQSVTYKTSVSICPANHNNVCSDDWSKPLMVFRDDDGNGLRGPEENILKFSDPLANGEKLVWKSSGSRRYIRYKFSGETRNQNGRLSYCSRENHVITQIILYHTGRARVAGAKEIKQHCQVNRIN